MSTFRLSDLQRESERLKGQIEERDGEIALLMRKLKVVFSKFRKKQAESVLFHSKFPMPVFNFASGAEC